MKTKLLLFNILTLLALAVALLRGQGAGPLNPPGPPSDGFYRTLEEVYCAIQAIEKRTPIDSVPFVITQSGSYYLTRELVFSGPDPAAITIDTSNVTLDLNGFSIRSTPGTGGYGIRIGTAVDSDPARITIRNGFIVGNSTVTQTGTIWSSDLDGFISGITMNHAASGVRLVDLGIAGCRGAGVHLGRNSVVTGCNFHENGGNGASSDGGIFMSCSASKNLGRGISGASSVINSQSHRNRGGGIRASVVSACSAGQNGVFGITGSVAQASVAFHSVVGFDAPVVSQCSATSNTMAGIKDPNSVSLSSAVSNSGGDIATTGTRTGNFPAP